MKKYTVNHGIKMYFKMLLFGTEREARRHHSVRKCSEFDKLFVTLCLMERGCM